jgi:predicted neuraminidase
VLFRRDDGALLLFYKVGPNPRQWWGMVKTSHDFGRTWSDARRLPDGILGPIKNKPIQLADGDILSPTSIESPQLGWRVYFERSGDGGLTWQTTDLVEQDAEIKAIQPSILVHSASELQAIGRTKNARLFTTRSHDAGRTWSRLRLLDLPNCNSGTDAVTLADGRHLLVYNHSEMEKVRYPLNIAVSNDGESWQSAMVLEDAPPGQYSYPSVIQSRDGLVHVVYTWKRLRIRYARINPVRLRLRPMPGGRWE